MSSSSLTLLLVVLGAWRQGEYLRIVKTLMTPSLNYIIREQYP